MWVTLNWGHEQNGRIYVGSRFHLQTIRQSQQSKDPTCHDRVENTCQQSELANVGRGNSAVQCDDNH